MPKYDYLIVGAGLSGSIIARELTKQGKKVLVIDKRANVGGNMACENIHGINVHKYGAHIFHTSNKSTWNYINNLTEMNNFTNSPLANYKGKFYNLPFNMNTFNQLWGATTPKEAKEIIGSQTSEYTSVTATNLEQKALSLVGKDIYEKLIKGYTEKQWGTSACELPAFIISRLPIRYTYDNNYFNDTYQGIPIGGYNKIFDNLLIGIDVLVNCDFLSDRAHLTSLASHIIYSGSIDEYFDYKFGDLEYRSLEFRHNVVDIDNFQGNAVVNYTDREVPYTRIIEHKHFEKSSSPKTVITYEYPQKYFKGCERYYPINNERNNNLYSQYIEYSRQYCNLTFVGRLGWYKYLDMNTVIEKSLDVVSKLC